MYIVPSDIFVSYKLVPEVRMSYKFATSLDSSRAPATEPLFAPPAYYPAEYNLLRFVHLYIGIALSTSAFDPRSQSMHDEVTVTLPASRLRCE